MARRKREGLSEPFSTLDNLVYEYGPTRVIGELSSVIANIADASEDNGNGEIAERYDKVHAKLELAAATAETQLMGNRKKGMRER